MSDTKSATSVTRENLRVSKMANENIGKLDNRHVVLWKRPLVIALMIIGGFGLGVAGVGLASFGAHQGWWAAGSLISIEQVNAITMMAIGGGGILFLIVGLVKAHQAVEHPKSQESTTTIDASTQPSRLIKPLSILSKEEAKLKTAEEKLPETQTQNLSEKPLVEEQKKLTAIITIQKILRAQRVRDNVSKIQKISLDYSLFMRAKPYVDTPSTYGNLPRASFGRTRVYLPSDLPVVLKQSGSPANQQRFEQMQDGQEICDQNGYIDLKIPKARIYGNFIIEQRLPITMHGFKEQIGLYIENLDRFTRAVKEFVGFFCQSEIEDITGHCDDPYAVLSETPIGRYDNVALYLEGTEGKIGLIDLEKFSPECNKKQEKWHYYKARTAVHLFPHHLDEIISVVQTFEPDIEKYRRDLELQRDEALKRFQIIYEDHFNFIQEKGIRIEDPTEYHEMTPERINEIQLIINADLLQEAESGPYKGCLGENPNLTLERFNQNTFPQIMANISQFINGFLDHNLQKYNGREITSLIDVLAIRSLKFDVRTFSLHYQVDLTMFNIDNHYQYISFLDVICEKIFTEMVTGGEIAFYHPRLGRNPKQCIFC